MIRPRARRLLVLALLSFPACVSLSKEYVEKRHYVLAAVREDATRAPVVDAVLSVRPFKSGPGLDGPGLVYRLEEARYETDFYNEFFGPPTDFVTAAFRGWLADAGLVRVVLEPGSLAEADYVLDGTLTRLHGDYRSKEPAAVLELQVFLTRMGTGGPEVVLHREYSEQEPLPRRRADELVAALNRALARVLARCEADLEAFLRPGPSPPHGG